MKNVVLVLALAVLLCSGGLSAQSLPTVVSYPSVDSGWSLNGQVGPLSCAGSSCTYTLSDVYGNATTVTRTIGAADKGEQQLNELLQVQSNGQDSFANLLVDIPTNGNYIITAAVLGQQSSAPLGGQSVYPVMNFVVNGALVSFCAYPNATSITATQYLTVNNPKGARLEYAYSCSISLSAGNNTIGVQIVGGQAHGGLLTVRHLMVYPWTANEGDQIIEGNVTCYTSGGVKHTSVQTGPNIFTVETNALSWTHTTCGSQSDPVVNLQTGFFVPGQGCNGTSRCALIQMD